LATLTRLLNAGMSSPIVWLLPAIALCMQVQAQEPFGIQFIDEQTKRPIPLVEIQTVHHLKLVSDNLGWIAIDEPELLNSRVFFDIRAHGYEFPKDGFGYAGKTILCAAGDRYQIELKRVQPAERLYRTTGLGRYVHSKKLGIDMTCTVDHSHNAIDFEYPVGCDSVLTAVLDQKRYWFWGDTQAIHYPLGGSFHMTGATTDVAYPSIDTQPPVYDYFRDNQHRIRPMAQMPGEGPTWISGLVVVKDSNGKNTMLANYVKIRKELKAYRWGFVRWNQLANRFDQAAEFDQPPKLFPASQVHTLEWTEPTEQITHVYLCGPFPNIRVLATEQSYLDPTQYQGFTCLEDGTTFEQRKLDRQPDGTLIYRWRRDTPPLTQSQEATLVREKLLKDSERRYRLLDAESMREVQIHNGSVLWNPYRNAWSMIFTEKGGKKSLLGEIWYSESSNLEGPWTKAVKVASHDQYSFYNPMIHPVFGTDPGRTLYFEGTYTTTFSGNQNPTPRYDYNQILYRLNLDSLGLP